MTQKFTQAQLTNPTVGGGPLMYGRGEDGDHVLSGNEQLTAPKHYRNLTLGARKLDTNGFPLFVSGLLSISASGILCWDGPDAVGYLGGTTLNAAFFCIGGAGGNGGNPGPAGDGIAPSYQSGGGAGGGGGIGVYRAASGGAVPYPITTDTFDERDVLLASRGHGPLPVAFGYPGFVGGLDGGGGGAGGGGGDTTGIGGGGGAGGPVLCVNACRIINAGTIRAAGGHGASGIAGGNSEPAGGGGGGGGGYVFVVCDFYSGNAPTAPGGTKGLHGASGGDDGTNGSAGNVKVNVLA